MRTYRNIVSYIAQYGFVRIVASLVVNTTLLLTVKKEGRKCLFNDALNTFYLRLYGVRHIVKDHSDSEKANPLPSHRLLFPINSNGSFYMHHPTDRIAHTTAFVTPVVKHWLELSVKNTTMKLQDKNGPFILTFISSHYLN